MVARNQTSNSRRQIRWIAISAGAVLSAAVSAELMPRTFADTSVVVPPPVLTEPVNSGVPSERAILAGGCFWGVQAVFQHLKGVNNVISGYAGGNGNTAQYETVGGGQTGHAESVEIEFDPRLINYGTILQVYFAVAHDPTELDHQGPDWGTQYRSAIFPANNAQMQVAKAYIRQLDKAGTFAGPIVTRIESGKAFYPAEAYHQDYATLHPDQPYIAFNDLPKISNLSRLFPDLYRPKARLVADIAASN